MVIPERVEFFPEDPTRPTGDGHFDSYAQPPAVWPEFLTGQPERPVRVLLVDDNEHVRRVIAQDLMADPRTLLVAQAASMKEGRKAIKQYDFDVMLVDLNLGDGDGLGLIDCMKSAHPSAEAVVISIMENDANVLRAFELGAVGFWVKNSWFGNYALAELQGGKCGPPPFAAF